MHQQCRLVRPHVELDIFFFALGFRLTPVAAALALLQRGDTSRDLYLFDTYEGMSAPTADDVMFDGQTAKALLDLEKPTEDHANYWCFAGLEDVKRNLYSTGYPKEKLHFIKGKVEDTLPGQAPDQIALLRLDTDWYESTAHELKHLFPRLSQNGVLIIDDYGHWLGARKAVDEYFAQQPLRPLLQRLDYTGVATQLKANDPLLSIGSTSLSYVSDSRYWPMPSKFSNAKPSGLIMLL